MGNSDPIIVMLFVILAPGIPAYILYSRLPPEKTIVTGPFKGLEVQLTGAFAAYFLLVLVAMGFMMTLLNRRREWLQSSQYETWIVKGELALEAGGPPARLTEALITFSPRLFEVQNDGSFYTVLPLQTGMQGKATTMQIESRPYNTAVVHLSKNAAPREYGTAHEIEFDTVNHIININSPIVLKAPGSKYADTLGYEPSSNPDAQGYEPMVVPDP